MVNGLGKIEGKWAVIIGFDNKVMAGRAGPSYSPISWCYELMRFWYAGQFQHATPLESTGPTGMELGSRANATPESFCVRFCEGRTQLEGVAGWVAAAAGYLLVIAGNTTLARATRRKQSEAFITMKSDARD